MTRVARTGSTEEKIVPQSPLAKRKSVKHAMIKTEDSALTSVRAVSKLAWDRHSMTCADFIDGLEAILSPVMLRVTFVSPTIVKRGSVDILKTM